MLVATAVQDSIRKCSWFNDVYIFWYVCVHSKRSSGSNAFFSHQNTTTVSALCCPGDGGVASSLPSQASLASSSSLDLFDPLPTSVSATTNPTRKTPESFLGPNAALVNLDSLVTKPAQPPPVVNPFLASTGGKTKRRYIKEFKIWNVLTLTTF